MKKLILILFCSFSSLFGGNGIVIGWHYNHASWSQSEQGIPSNRGRQLSVTTGGPLYGTSGASIEPTPGANVAYSLNWDNGSGTKGWVFPMTTSGFTNLTISFYQKSRTELGNYGPRNFKLQYSTNGTAWADVTGANFVLTSSWQQFNVTLPSACNNQTILYLKWVMSSNISVNGGAIVPAALSDFADFFMYGDEIQLPITDISLSNTGLAHNQPIGTTVGTLTATDANYYDTHTFSLVSGAGGTHNGSFTIVGNTLKTAADLPVGSYSIRVQASDGTNTLIENYIITVSAYPIVVVGDPTWNSDAWITRVQFGTIDKSSGQSGANNALGYSNFTENIATVTQGESVSLAITANVVTTYTENIRVYFDWNHDYDLTDEGEHFDLLTGSGAVGTLSENLNISIPSGLATGNTLMRVVIDNGSNLALGGSDYGEVEDYTVNIIASVSFTNGSGFTPSVTPNSANQILGRFQLTGSADGAALTAVSIKLNGLRTGLSNFKLWSSTDASFGDDTQLGSTIAADPGNGSSITFNSFSNPISSGGIYYFLTADVAADATGTLQGVIVQNSSLTISSGTLSGTISNAVLSAGELPLPVELTSFTASIIDNKVNLVWQTATEVNNYGFEVERSEKSEAGSQKSDWKKISFVEGSGNSNSPKKYSFIDENPPSGNLQYRLKQIDTDGRAEYFSTISVINNISSAEDNQLPGEFGLLQNYPNPFNPSTTIKYALPEKSRVTVEIYNMLGEKIATLVNEVKNIGYHEISFNGNNYPSGIFIYKLTASSLESGKLFAASQKMTLIK